MSKHVIAVGLLLLTFSSSLAFAESKRELIEGLLENMRLWDSTAAIFENNPGMLIGDIKRRYPRLGEEDVLLYAEALKQLYLEDLESPSSELRQSYIDFYDRNFSTTEIEDLYAFFSSNTAQKYLNTQGHLIQEIVVITEAWSYAIGPRLHDRVETLIEGDVDEG